MLPLEFSKKPFPQPETPPSMAMVNTNNQTCNFKCRANNSMSPTGSSFNNKFSVLGKLLESDIDDIMMAPNRLGDNIISQSGEKQACEKMVWLPMIR